MNASVPASPIQILRDPERAASFLHPVRRRLLAALGEEPDSAAGLARRLGESRQRLNYHLRTLEDAELVELAEERRRGNFMERVFRLTAQRFVLDPGTLGELGADPDRAQDRFSSAYLVALSARAIRELAELRERADEEDKRLATFALDTRIRLGAPSDLEAFSRDLTRAVAEVVARHHDEKSDGGREMRLFLGLHPGPDPSKPSASEDSDEGSEKETKEQT